MLFSTVAYGQNEGIRPWEMRNANGAKYFMVSGVDSVMYYDLLDDYIRDTLGYSRIDSIKCVTDTIRIYTNNGQFKMPFSCSGGSGISSLNGLTAGTQTFATGTTGTDFAISSATSTHTFNLPTASATNRGALSTTDWSTFNSKIGGSGAASYVPFFSGTSILTAQHDFLTKNTSLGFQVGIGHTSGGNSVLDNYFRNNTTTAGLSIYDLNSAALGLATSTSNRWSMFTDTGEDWNLYHHGGGSWAEFMRITDNGAYYLPHLNGTGTKIVQVDQFGLLSPLGFGTQGQVLTMSTNNAYAWSFPSGGTSGLTAYGSIYEGTSTQQYEYNSPTNNPIKILYQTLGTGGNITYTPTTSAGNFIVPSSGVYEIFYGHDVRCTKTSTGTEILWSSIYINDGQIAGTNSVTTEVYTTNKSYHHTGRIVRSLTSGQAVQVKVALSNSTGAWQAFVSGAQLSLKKLN